MSLDSLEKGDNFNTTGDFNFFIAYYVTNNDIVKGVIFCFLASLGFGSMHIPMLRHNKGNGALALFGLGVGVFLGSMLQSIIYRNTYLNIYPMFGGLLWTIANFCSFFVIDTYGIGVGMLLWNNGNCLTGWLTGYFGLFGVKKRRPNDFLTNILGILFIILSGIIFSCVKKVERKRGYDNKSSKNVSNKMISTTTDSNELSKNNIVRYITKFKKVLAIFVALICGFCYASTSTPIYYLLDNSKNLITPDIPNKSSTFIPSLGIGIFISTSLFFFCSVGFYGLNDVLGNKKIMISSICSGIIWLVSMCCMLYAIEKLSQTITYPIMSITPGLIAMLWSLFYFKEIRGLKNFIAIGVAVLIAVFGISLVVISKL
uniref:Transmembrane protein 144 n=1 Tax=Parastrongyloides trichosuri TaxID=131310 RepID=A0A0N4ZCH4_PARTI